MDRYQSDSADNGQGCAQAEKAELAVESACKQEEAKVRLQSRTCQAHCQFRSFHERRVASLNQSLAKPQTNDQESHSGAKAQASELQL